MRIVLKFSFSVSFLVGSFLAAPVSAELHINPNPVLSGPSALPAPAVPADISYHDSFPVKVPQPGDAYFDPPSDAYSPNQDAQAGAQIFEATETFQKFSGGAQSESFSTAVSAQEPLKVQMSADPFEGIQNEPQEVQPSALLQSQPQDVEPASGGAPEEIIWSGPRVEVQAAQTGPSWTALQGANISQVLGIWSRQADVELIWDTPNAFAVLESLEIGGTYEEAVQGLLDQYKDNQVRPVATLHVEPESGRKTLIVQGLDES